MHNNISSINLSITLSIYIFTRFPKKSYKHSQESRYWKKYQNVLMEKDENMQINDISFCKGEKPYLMAAAISARVDIYSLT